MEVNGNQEADCSEVVSYLVVFKACLSIHLLPLPVSGRGQAGQDPSLARLGSFNLGPVWIDRKSVV